MKAITRTQFALAEQVRAIYVVTPEPGATFEGFLKPEVTQNIAADLRPGFRLEVMPEDQAWYAELMVKDSGRNWVKFHTLQYVELVPPQADQPEADGSEYLVSWGGPNQKFRVTRKADNAVLQSGFADKKAAQAWIAEHEKATA